jgi:hypothetical protein
LTKLPGEVAPCKQLAPKDRNYCDVTLSYSLL